MSGKNTASYALLQRLTAKGYNPFAMLTGKGPLKLEDVGKQLPPASLQLAERLAKYPELIEPLSKTVEAHENLARVKEALQSEIEHRKAKRGKT